MANNGAVQRHELEEIITRMDWVDEERRKTSRLIASLEHRVEQQEQEIGKRDRRIQELEQRLTTALTQLNRVSNVDVTLQQFKDELVNLIEQYDQRRIQATEESDRLRRVEAEMTVREIAEVRKELPEITRLRTDMELRQAEESRLSNLIGKLQTRLSAVDNRIENWERDISFVREKENQALKSVNQLEVQISEINRRLEPVANRLDVLQTNMLRAEANINDLTGLQVEVRQAMKGWMDQIQLGEYERNQRLENWKQLIEDHQNQLEMFKREWISISDQYKEAQLALQTLNDWQRTFELQQREVMEKSRVETNRIQSSWDRFLADNEKRWRNFEVDFDQKAAEGGRRDRQLEEQIYELMEKIKVLEAEKDALWRVQTAQLDAVKNFPRVWLEEVEKARARDPNRRRQPALVPVDDDV